MAGCICGYQGSPDARFCSGCGRPLDDPALNDPDISVPDVSVLDITGPEVVTEQAVVKAISNQRRWVAIAGVICAALIAWSAWTLIIGGDPPAEGASPTSTPPDEADDRGAESTVEPVTSTTTAPSTSSTERTTTSPPPQVETVGAPVPILGEEVAYDLIIGTVERPAVLDLDSGEIRYANGSRADPLAVTGHWLIAGRNNPPFILDLNDLEADPIRLSLPDSNWFQIAGNQQRDDGRAWFWRSFDGTSESGFVLIEVATGRIVDEFTWPTGTNINNRAEPGPAGKPPLVSTPAGGIYEARGDGFVRVAGGDLLLADARRALVETCDDQLRCTLHWLDRETWQPIDLAVPDDRGDNRSFVNGTDWALIFSFSREPSAHLFNVVTGKRFELTGPDEVLFGYLEHGPAISPDGRWLATASAGEVRFVELETGQEIVVDLLRGVVGPVIFFERPS